MKLVSPLTKKQKECEAYMRKFYRVYKKFPSVRNVAKALNISSTAAHARIVQVKSKSIKLILR